MPDWKSPTELAANALAFNRLNHALLGIYAYEWFISLDFEWDLITGKRRFRWPLIFYFLNRYLLLFALIGIVIALDTTYKIDCQALYLFNQLIGNAAAGLASINLSIRTMAVWSQNIYVTGFLIVMILGHWSLILQGVLLKATWMDGVGCIITSTNNRVLAATFIYTMCFDFLVLSLNAYKLVGGKSRTSGLAGSRLAKMIFEDGLIFFMIAFLANLIATIFMLLDLNQIMSVIFNVPAVVASTIVACRVVRRLTNFQNRAAEVYGASGSQTAGINIRGASNTMAQRAVSSVNPFGQTKSGVHVQMETFTQEDILDGKDIEDQSATPSEYEEKRPSL